MADKRIKGITIEIDGETTGLQKALADVDKKGRDIQSELRQVEKLLKFNPGNTELLAQKQKLLSDQVANTTERLERLKTAQKQVEQQFKNGEIGEEQYRAFQRELIQTESKLDKFKKELQTVGDNNGFKEVSKDAEEAKKSIGELGNELASVAGGLVAGGGIAGAISQALDSSSLNTKIDITFDIPNESKQAVKDAVLDVTAVIEDQESALEGIRRQWALNKDATDEANRAVVEGAATIVAAYEGIDFTELIQEVNEISNELNISNQEALGLTNALLNAGFPPEQIDIIAEYGKQLKDAGFNAQEIQAIMAAGVDTGSWNIDNLLDGLKEGRIKLAEFGQEVPEATKELLANTDISIKQLQAWGQAVAAGGEEGRMAMQEVAQALVAVDDETTKNALGVQIFGTKWEDQGVNITDTILGMNEQLSTAKENQDALNEATSKLNADPAIQMKKAFSDMKVALEPLLLVVSFIVSKFAEWMSENPEIVATIAAITSAIGIISGAILALTPIISTLTSVLPSLGAAISALSGPIGIVIGVIGLLVTAFLTAYEHSETFREKVDEVFEAIKSTVETVIETVTSFLKEKLETIRSFWEENSETIMQAADNAFNFIKGVIEFVMPVILTIVKDTWGAIKSVIDGALNVIMGIVKTFSGLLTGDFEKMWEGIKQMFSGAVEALWGIIQLGVVGKIFKLFKLFGDKVMDVIKLLFGNMKKKFDEIVNMGETKFNALKDKLLQPVTNIKDTIFGMIDGIKNAFSNFKISIPKLKLPHIDVDWKKFGVGDLSVKVPTFDINWYAKGGIFNSPSVIGVGEAGKEAVLPLEGQHMKPFAEEIARQMSKFTGGLNGQIVVPVYLDGYEIAKVVYPHVDSMQGRAISSNNRYNGVR